MRKTKWVRLKDLALGLTRVWERSKRREQLLFALEFFMILVLSGMMIYLMYLLIRLMRIILP